MSGTPIGSRISAISRSKIRIKLGQKRNFGIKKGYKSTKRFLVSWVFPTASWESSTDSPTLFANALDLWRVFCIFVCRNSNAVELGYVKF